MARPFIEIVKETLASLLDPAILPYYGLNLCYGLTQVTDLENSYGPLVSVVFKTAPIWYLIFFVKFVKMRRMAAEFTTVSQTSLQYTAEEEATYNQDLTAGLVFSLLGDALLVYSDTFVPGIFAFAVGHIFYILALRKRFGAIGYAWLVFPVCMISSPYILMEVQPQALGSLVVLYNLLLNTTLVYAIASVESRRGVHTFLAAVGASSFVLSDSLLAYDMWISAIPYRSLFVMSSYYFAQVCLTLSVF